MKAQTHEINYRNRPIVVAVSWRQPLDRRTWTFLVVSALCPSVCGQGHPSVPSSSLYICVCVYRYIHGRMARLRKDKSKTKNKEGNKKSTTERHICKRKRLKRKPRGRNHSGSLYHTCNLSIRSDDVVHAQSNCMRGCIVRPC